MKARPFFILAILMGVAGCNSVEAQRRRFIRFYDQQIGLPFFANEKRGMREVKISATESEFVPDPTPEFGVAWRVDTSARGPYRTSSRTFETEGVKKSWRVIGDPQKALMGINWLDW